MRVYVCMLAASAFPCPQNPWPLAAAAAEQLQRSPRELRPCCNACSLLQLDTAMLRLTHDPPAVYQAYNQPVALHAVSPPRAADTASGAMPAAARSRPSHKLTTPQRHNAASAGHAAGWDSSPGRNGLFDPALSGKELEKPVPRPSRIPSDAQAAARPRGTVQGPQAGRARATHTKKPVKSAHPYFRWRGVLQAPALGAKARRPSTHAKPHARPASASTRHRASAHPGTAATFGATAARPRGTATKPPTMPPAPQRAAAMPDPSTAGHQRLALSHEHYRPPPVAEPAAHPHTVHFIEGQPSAVPPPVQPMHQARFTAAAAASSTLPGVQLVLPRGNTRAHTTHWQSDAGTATSQGARGNLAGPAGTSSSSTAQLPSQPAGWTGDQASLPGTQLGAGATVERCVIAPAASALADRDDTEYLLAACQLAQDADIAAQARASVRCQAAKSMPDAMAAAHARAALQRATLAAALPAGAPAQHEARPARGKLLWMQHRWLRAARDQGWSPRQSCAAAVQRSDWIQRQTRHDSALLAHARPGAIAEAVYAGARAVLRESLQCCTASIDGVLADAVKELAAIA